MNIRIEQAATTITTGPEKFEDFAKQTEGRGFLSIISSDNGYLLLGPYGLLKDENGNSLFQNVSELHELIRSWGFKYFYQDGQPKQFSETA